MKRFFYSLLLPVCACVWLLCGCTRSGGWEYKSTTATGSMSEAELNKLGKDGWELTGYTYTRNPSGGGNDHSHYVFKRPKRNPDWWKFWK